MALGVGWYESQIELNKLDFDFDRTWRDQTRRLFTTDGYRFDDNNRVLNVGHAFMGAYYHQFARQNGGGMAEALLFDFVTSSTWELTVEHREVISLNDTVTTSLGGVAVGESLYQLGDFFARSRPTVANRILMGLFSPAHAAGLLWGDRPEPVQRRLRPARLRPRRPPPLRPGPGRRPARSGGAAAPRRPPGTATCASTWSW